MRLTPVSRYVLVVGKLAFAAEIRPHQTQVFADSERRKGNKNVSTICLARISEIHDIRGLSPLWLPSYPTCGFHGV